MLKKLGLISIIGAIASVIFMFLINATFGLIVYIISFIVAAYDLFRAYKEENLTPREFLQVAIKENLFSVITVFSIAVIIWIFSIARLGEAQNALYDNIF